MNGPDFSSLKSFDNDSPKKRKQALKKIKEIDSEDEEDDKNAYLTNPNFHKTGNLNPNQIKYNPGANKINSKYEL